MSERGEVTLPQETVNSSKYIGSLFRNNGFRNDAFKNAEELNSLQCFYCEIHI